MRLRKPRLTIEGRQTKPWYAVVPNPHHTSTLHNDYMQVKGAQSPE
eukprot:COSAG01_NODE_144_length_24108_cov_11.490441_12_plen_46_part_00